MELNRLPMPGDIYRHFKDKLYQIITIAIHSETGEALVIYQAMYGDFKVYARPLSMFQSEVDHEKYPGISQRFRFELYKAYGDTELSTLNGDVTFDTTDSNMEDLLDLETGEVNSLLIKFLEAESYTKKLEVITSNKKHLDDRLITDMSVSLDLVMDEGSLEDKINGLINCLQAMRRFEDRRTR